MAHFSCIMPLTSLVALNEDRKSGSQIRTPLLDKKREPNFAEFLPTCRKARHMGGSVHFSELVFHPIALQQQTPIFPSCHKELVGSALMREYSGKRELAKNRTRKR